MCGIAGFVQRQGRASPEVLARQLSQLRHRGPDAEGWFVRGRGAIGQTRLAIIDLVTGDPPVTEESGCIGVALNGEIYNFRELRAALTGRGHVMATTGDTEVIAHLAEELGPVELATSLHGMFAFAVWDEVRERLILGRDRLGKKPLYVWRSPDAVVFGSEIKAITAHPAVPVALDPRAIPAYLTFGYVPTPFSFYEGIHSVPPGHVLVVERDLTMSLERYWEAPRRGAGYEAHELSMAEASAEVRTRLAAAVERRLISDVPLGAFLSGGIDSSAVVALIASHSSRPVRTFTIGFEDSAGFDERHYARLVARRFATEHTEFVVEPSAVDLVERLVWHHDQPFGDSSAIPTYLLAELTKQHVTVALCGDGGDELFAGYERLAAGAWLGAWARVPGPVRSGVTSAVQRVPAGLLGGRGAKLGRFLAVANRGLPHGYRAWISYLPDDIVERLLPGRWPWALDDYEEIWEGTAGATGLDRLLLLNLRTYLLDDLLPKVDRMSMAHGLEVRTPFLDHELVEFAFRLPGRLKARGMSLKRCLRAAMADVLPGEILRRPKRGFGVPLDRWFRDELAGYVDAMLGSPSARIRSHLVPGAVDTLLEQHRQGTAQHGHALWTLLTLEVFLRRQGW